MKRVIGATVIAALSCVVVTAQTAPSRSPQRNVVLDWNRIVMTTVGIRNGVEQVRIAAIAHLAIFEAVNAVAGDFTPYLESTVPSPDASVEAAAIAAAHRVLVKYVQEQEGQLGIEREHALSAIEDGPAKRLGLSLGERIADAMILNRENDGAEPPSSTTLSETKPGTGS